MEMRVIRCPGCNGVLLQASVYESRSSLDWIKCASCKQRVQVMACGDDIRTGMVDAPARRIAQSA